MLFRKTSNRAVQKMTNQLFVICSWRSYLSSDHVSVPNIVYTPMASRGLGQSLNAKCGLADASTSMEIRSESTRRHYSTPNPRGQVQIRMDPLWLNHQPLLHNARKTFTVSQPHTFHSFFHFATYHIHRPDRPGVCVWKSVRLLMKSHLSLMCAAKPCNPILYYLSFNS